MMLYTFKSYGKYNEMFRKLRFKNICLNIVLSIKSKDDIIINAF